MDDRRWTEIVAAIRGLSEDAQREAVAQAVRNAASAHLGDTSENVRRRLIPVTRWTQFHPWPSVAGMRHLIFHAESNGFHAVLRRVGRRVLVDEQAFFAWADRRAKREK